MLNRLIAVTAAWDDVEHRVGTGTGTDLECGKDDYSGIELDLAGLFMLRRGHLKTQFVDGTSWGWGIGCEWKGVAAFRFDHASVPREEGLEDRTGNGFSASVNVLRLLQER